MTTYSKTLEEGFKERFPDDTYDIPYYEAKSFLTTFAEKIRGSVREECEKIVVEENYILEEYLMNLSEKVSGFDIAQHTMKTRNNITKRISLLAQLKDK